MWHSIGSRHRLPPVAAPALVTLAIMGFLLVGLGTTATAVWSLHGHSSAGVRASERGGNRRCGYGGGRGAGGTGEF